MLISTTFNRVATAEVFFGMHSNSFEIPLVQGDTGPLIRLALRDAAGAAISVSGGVNLYLGHRSMQVNVGHEACSGFDPSGGLWDYSLQPGDLAEAGTYFGDVEIEFDDGRTETAYEAVRFMVRQNHKGVGA